MIGDSCNGLGAATPLNGSHVPDPRSLGTVELVGLIGVFTEALRFTQHVYEVHHPDHDGYCGLRELMSDMRSDMIALEFELASR